MAHEIVMPQMGLSMDTGQIIKWLKKPSEMVRPGELLLEVESDKSIVEVEAIAGGILHIERGPEDGQIPVGEVIAYLLAEGERPPSRDKQAGGPVELIIETPAMLAENPVADQTSSIGERNWLHPERPPSSPAARRRAKELELDWRMATPSGGRGQIKERDIFELKNRTKVSAQIESAAQPAGEPVSISYAEHLELQITPVARRMAEATGVDIGELARQYPGKRLERFDIEQALKQTVQQQREQAAEAGLVNQIAPAAHTPSHRQPVSSLRRLVAERMALSAYTTAAVTLTTKADATELVRIRESLKADGQSETVPSYNVLIACLVARALVEHPALNASIEGQEIVYWETANIGIAVDTPRGLVVPVLRDVQDKSVRAIAKQANDLLHRAAEGKAFPDELTGSTFTITNLGSYEIDAFTPIINPPECAVLGVGRLVKENVVVDDQPAIRTMLALSLTFDHRLVDGAPAARFLQRVKHFIEQPYLWLV